MRSVAPEIIERYPEGRQRSALLPLLHEAQARDGYVTRAAIDEVAAILELTAAEVLGVASFYHMLKLKPAGRHIVSVCHNLACSMLGAEKVISALEQELGISCGETTPDGEFHLERAECLADCDAAPMLQIDYDRMVGPLTPDQAVALLSDVKSETLARPAAAPAEAPVPTAVQPSVQASPGAAERDVDAATDIEARQPAEEEPAVPAREVTPVEPLLIDSIQLSETEETLMHREIHRSEVEEE